MIIPMMLCHCLRKASLEKEGEVGSMSYRYGDILISQIIFKRIKRIKCH